MASGLGQGNAESDLQAGAKMLTLIKEYLLVYLSKSLRTRPYQMCGYVLMVFSVGEVDCLAKQRKQS